MKCTGNEWNHCRVEKMGCPGCYYNENKLEEAKKILEDYAYASCTISSATERDEKISKAIETVLQALQNSITKKKIEDKIKEYMEYDKKVKTYTSDGRENFTMEYFYAKNLQELLEDK